MGCAHASRLEEDETFTTLELKINFMKPVWDGGRLAEVEQVIKAGGRLALARLPNHRRVGLAGRLRDVDLHDVARACRGTMT